MKRRDDKSGVASFDISSFRVRMLDSCQGAKAEKASTAQTGGTSSYSYEYQVDWCQGCRAAGITIILHTTLDTSICFTEELIFNPASPASRSPQEFGIESRGGGKVCQRLRILPFTSIYSLRHEAGLIVPVPVLSLNQHRVVAAPHGCAQFTSSIRVSVDKQNVDSVLHILLRHSRSLGIHLLLLS